MEWDGSSRRQHPTADLLAGATRTLRAASRQLGHSVEGLQGGQVWLPTRTSSCTVLAYRCAAAWETGALIEERSHRTVCTRMPFRVHLMGVLLLLLLQRPQGQGDALRCDARRDGTTCLSMRRSASRVVMGGCSASFRRGSRCSPFRNAASASPLTCPSLVFLHIQLYTVHYCGRIE